MGGADGNAGANGEAEDDTREVEGFHVDGVLDGGMTADGRLVLVVHAGGGPLALSLSREDAERAAALFLAQMPPSGAGVDIVTEASLSGGEVEADAASVEPPAAEGEPFVVHLSRDGQEQLTLRMPTRRALHFARDLTRQIAAHMKDTSGG